ncbi:MAG: FtsB family cell division protein [Bacillota bacterium]
MYRLISTIAVLVAFGLLFMMGIQYVQQLRVRQELADYEDKVLFQQRRQDDLQVEIERLQNLDYIEILARDRLGLVKPDEIIFQLED